MFSIRIPVTAAWMTRKILQLRSMVVDGWGQYCVHNTFSISQAYKVVLPISEPVQWWKLIRSNKATPKGVFVVWLICHQQLLTMDRIARWRVILIYS